MMQKRRPRARPNPRENIEKELESWVPKTELGKKVKSGEITDLNELIQSGTPILEPQIVDKLIPDLETEFLTVGQSKGKFGGGKGSIWKQTQKKTKETNIMKFSAFVAVGNKKGILGIGYGSAKETLPARTKAIRNAKLNLISIKTGCGSWACGCGDLHSIPFKVSGGCGSVKMELMPAPKGAGLVIDNKCKIILELAGLKDIYSKTKGQTRTRINLFRACFEALKNINKVRTGNE